MRESEHIGLRLAGTVVFTAMLVPAFHFMFHHGFRWILAGLVACNICGVIGIWKGVKRG
jgi:hypothetical protein